jgi:hypothetical protein
LSAENELFGVAPGSDACARDDFLKAFLHGVLC